MTTLRKELTLKGFNWNKGIILYQPVKDTAFSPGWIRDEDTHPTRTISGIDSILDMEYDNGFGIPNCPRFIADDGEYIYFPVQYDGSTYVSKIRKNIFKYINSEEPLPYPGG